MRRRRQLWFAGLALVLLLAFGVAVVSVWPKPSEAERTASTLRLGTTLEQARSRCNADVFPLPVDSLLPPYRSFHCVFADGSRMTVTATREQEDNSEFRVSALQTTPPERPRTRLLRVLARFIPGQKE